MSTKNQILLVKELKVKTPALTMLSLLSRSQLFDKSRAFFAKASPVKLRTQVQMNVRKPFSRYPGCSFAGRGERDLITCKTENRCSTIMAMFSSVAVVSLGLVTFADTARTTSLPEKSLSKLSDALSNIETALDLEERINSLSKVVLETKTISEVETNAKFGELENMSSLRLALCQISVGVDKAANLVIARKAIDAAVRGGAKLVALPECFQCPYDTMSFPEYAEVVPQSRTDLNVELSPSTAMLIEAAAEHGIYIIGGSIPEVDCSCNIYNTCIVICPDGEIVAKHRKVHLFDIDVPGRITFKESDTLTAGDSFTSFDMPQCKVGIGICYDIRFPEQSMIMRENGCHLLVFPGAFNMTTGPAHWELLQRARAVDNQLYVATISPARNPDASYHAWGHSSVISPWGDVVATTEHDSDIVFCDLDFTNVEEIRENIPVSKQKRKDLYTIKRVEKQ
jgi:omega-amidase